MRAEDLIDTRFASSVAGISKTLQRFGMPALQFAHQAQVKIVPLHRTQRYVDASPALQRLSVTVDDWPAPPAGLFVVEERSVYLRSRSPMTVAHEFGHGLDCALGGGVYFSSVDPQLHRLFSDARHFVTPYSATGIDEYFAEGLRAFVEVNDEASLWPKATRTRLQQLDPAFYAYIKRLFKVNFNVAA